VTSSATRAALTALALAVAFAPVTGGCRRNAPRKSPARHRDPRLAPAERAADLVARMTPAEKIGQLMTDAPGIPRLGVPAYDWWNEALHGVARAGRATVFPQAIALAATFDPDLVHEIASAISDEARAKFNLAQARGQRGRYQGLTFFTPNVNIFRDPRWGRGQETFGEDPFLTSAMGVAFITGLQGEDPRLLKTLATAKHFAVHSGPEAARHGFDARVSPHDLADTYLPQFAACVRAGRAGSVMAAYNRVNGEACVSSPTLLAQTLRERWQFDGYVVGDCGAVTDSYAHHRLFGSLDEAAAAALRTGTDLDCGSGFRALGGALRKGLVTGADLDRAAIRLFTARYRLGLFDPPGQSPWADLGAAVIESPAHLTLARAAAARSIVLLENRAGALPLGPAVRKLAVIGPTAENVPVLLANYHGLPTRPVTLLGGITAAAQARGLSVDYVRGARLLDATDGTIADAVAAARAADLTVAVVGLDPRLEGEEGETRLNKAGDRRAIELPAAQHRLLEAVMATGRPVVVVVTGGSAIAMPWVAAHAAALLYAWYPGAEGGNAVADVLFGAVSPAGRLPITLYRSTADLPPFADYAMRGRTYRYFTGEPLYPFGFGLGYSRFRYANPVVTAPASAPAPWSLSVDVTNEGGRAADEVIQVYALPRSVPDYAPGRWLIAFARVTLGPGERRTVHLAPSPDALTYVDGAGARRPLTGVVMLAIGSRQPDRSGSYADATLGVTAALALPSL
jgi:beta-glucosidase